MLERLATETTQSRGSKEPAMKAFTVMARVSLPTLADTMVTPVAKHPITRRNSAGESGSGDSGALTARPVGWS
jgi:hypothetical protein